MNQIKPSTSESTLWLYHVLAWLILLLTVVGLSYCVMVENMEALYKENSIVENAQVALLALACGLFSYAGVQLQAKHRIIVLFMAVLSFCFVFREVDFDKINGMPSVIVFMLAEQGRSIFWVGLLALFGLMIKDIPYYWTYLGVYLRSSLVVYIAIAAFLLIVFSTAFDQKMIVVEHRVFFEELSEMVAYYFILLASLFACSSLNAVNKQLGE